MAKVDLLLKNGRVLIGDALLETCVAVEGEKILGVGSESALPPGERVIDLQGKIVIPGLVDTHTHLREPGYTYKEDFTTGTQAAAVGGVTMVIDQPNCEPPTKDLKTFLEKKEIAKRKCIVDFNHLVFPSSNEEVRKVAEAGGIGYKIFMVRGEYPHDPRVSLDDTGLLLERFQAIESTNLPVMVHPCDMAIFTQLERRLRERGRSDYLALSEAYMDELLYSGPVANLIYLQQRANVKLHIFHTHGVEEIRLIREAKMRGQNVTCQVDPKYFLITKEELERLGPLVIPGGTIPQYRIEAIWKGINEGTIDVIGTDHAPHTKEEMEKARVDAFKAPWGNPQLEHYLSILLTEVNRGTLTLEHLSKICSTNPSKLVGLYPKKGVIAPGSDADLVVIDLKKEDIIKSDRLYTKVQWTPYEGRRVKGVPVMTFVRGEIVAESGEVVGKPGHGKFTPPLSWKGCSA
jgi:dihydroorotase